LSNIYIVGAHRTGKTTLAKALAETNGIPFVETRLSECILQFNGRTVRDMESVTGAKGFYDRLETQMHIGSVLHNLSKTKFGVFDRSIIDCLAYTELYSLDIYNTLSGCDLNISIADLMEFHSAIESLIDRNGIYIMLQPGIPTEEAGKSASLNSQARHTDLVFSNLIKHCLDVLVIPSTITDHTKRLEMAQAYVMGGFINEDDRI